MVTFHHFPEDDSKGGPNIVIKNSEMCNFICVPYVLSYLLWSPTIRRITETQLILII